MNETTTVMFPIHLTFGHLAGILLITKLESLGLH